MYMLGGTLTIVYSLQSSRTLIYRSVYVAYYYRLRFVSFNCDCSFKPTTDTVSY